MGFDTKMEGRACNIIPQIEANSPWIGQQNKCPSENMKGFQDQCEPYGNTVMKIFTVEKKIAVMSEIESHSERFLFITILDSNALLAMTERCSYINQKGF